MDLNSLMDSGRQICPISSFDSVGEALEECIIFYLDLGILSKIFDHEFYVTTCVIVKILSLWNGIILPSFRFWKRIMKVDKHIASGWSHIVLAKLQMVYNLDFIDNISPSEYMVNSTAWSVCYHISSQWPFTFSLQVQIAVTCFKVYLEFGVQSMPPRGPAYGWAMVDPNMWLSTIILSITRLGDQQPASHQ